MGIFVSTHKAIDLIHITQCEVPSRITDLPTAKSATKSLEGWCNTGSMHGSKFTEVVVAVVLVVVVALVVVVVVGMLGDKLGQEGESDEPSESATR